MGTYHAIVQLPLYSCKCIELTGTMVNCLTKLVYIPQSILISQIHLHEKQGRSNYIILLQVLTQMIATALNIAILYI